MLRHSVGRAERINLVRGEKRIITGVSFAQLSALCPRYGSHEMPDTTVDARAHFVHAPSFVGARN